MRQESGSYELVVEELGSVEPEREEAPDQEDALEHPVERDEGEDEIREELDDAEGCEHHPVGEPDRVVLLVPALDGQDGSVGGVDESDGVADELGPVSDDDQGGQHETGPQDYLPPLDARGRLGFYEVLVELVLLLQLLVQHEEGGIYGNHD